MKQNGVIIYRISDLKRFFDFFSFWNSQNEFFELVMPSGSIDDFFFDTELEKTCCAVFARCRRRYDNIWATVKFGENGAEFISSVSDNCRQRILYPKIWQLSREQADFYKRLEAIIMDRYTLMALFSLYMMIGHMPDEIELKNVLEIISENEPDFSNRVVVLKKDEKDFILLFLKTLGRSDVENQTKEIASFTNRFQEMRAISDTEYKKYGTLSLKLSLIAGLFFVIVLI